MSTNSLLKRAVHSLSFLFTFARARFMNALNAGVFIALASVGFMHSAQAQEFVVLGQSAKKDIYKPCAQENQGCGIKDGEWLMLYGSNSTWIKIYSTEKWWVGKINQEKGFLCSHTTFGIPDPVPNVLKTCLLLQESTGPASLSRWDIQQEFMSARMDSYRLGIAATQTKISPDEARAKGIRCDADGRPNTEPNGKPSQCIAKGGSVAFDQPAKTLFGVVTNFAEAAPQGSGDKYYWRYDINFLADTTCKDTVLSGEEPCKINRHDWKHLPICEYGLGWGNEGKASPLMGPQGSGYNVDHGRRGRYVDQYRSQRFYLGTGKGGMIFTPSSIFYIRCTAPVANATNDGAIARDFSISIERCLPGSSHGNCKR